MVIVMIARKHRDCSIPMIIQEGVIMHIEVVGGKARQDTVAYPVDSFHLQLTWESPLLPPCPLGDFLRGNIEILKNFNRKKNA